MWRESEIKAVSMPALLDLVSKRRTKVGTEKNR